MGCNQEIRDVDRVNFASDGSMVAGWALVLEYGIDGRAEGTGVDYRPLKFSAAALFCHFVGCRGQDTCDGARAAPGDDVIRFASGA